MGGRGGSIGGGGKTFTQSQADEAEAKAIKAMDDAYADYNVVGVRFDDIDRPIGSTVGDSKDNPDRDDERAFPEYGSAEYESLPTFDGTSAYGDRYARQNVLNSLDGYHERKHLYVIGAQSSAVPDYGDDGEILMKNPVVLARVY